MPTDTKETDIQNHTEREKERDRATEVHRIREVDEGFRRERMRAGQPPRGDIDPSRWGIDQFPLVWVATSKPADDKVPGPPFWTSLTDVFSPVTPLPYAPYSPCASGLATTGGEAELSKTPDCSTPELREGKALQSRVWEPELYGGPATAPTMRSVFRCPRPFPASNVETLQSNLRITFMPVVKELTEIRNPIDARESSTSREEGSQRSSSWVEDLIDGECMQNDATLNTLSSSSTYTGETSNITHHEASLSSGPCAPNRGERATASKDVSMFESLSDNDDLPYEEGVQVVSEKRRKRMLSNRASAQRSRQRRQERLDTLEVLVAELRVENATLNRRANLAASVAKKAEKENKTLRDRLGKLSRWTKPLPWSGTSNESDKTTENSDMGVNINKNGEPIRLYGGSIGPTRNHASSSADTRETHHDDSHSRDSSQPSKINRDDDKAGAENSKSWNNISSSSFDFEFNSDPMENVAGPFGGGGGGTLNRAAGVPEGEIGKDLYRSAMMAVPQTPSFQNLDSFGIELEQRNQEMDKKNFDSRSVEDIWLESLANCLQ